MKKLIEILDVSGQASAAATGTVIFTLPAGYRYYKLSIVGTIAPSGTPATMTAGLGDARLKIGGRVQRLADVVEHDSANALNNPPSGTWGTAAAVPYSVFNNAVTTNAPNFTLPYFFAEPWREQYAAKDRFALDVLPMDGPVTLEVDFKSVTAAPFVSLRAEVEDISNIAPQFRNRSANGALPTLVKHFRTTRTAAGTSLDITDLPRQDVYQLIRLYDPTGTYISAVQVEVDGQIIFKRTKNENDGDLRASGLNPLAISSGAGIFDIVPDAQDNPMDGWNMGGAGKFTLRITFAGSATGVVKLITHRFGLPE